jgi:hypothetical protein
MNGTLTLGYGSGGVAPQEFVLTPGQDLETGFLKIFISSKPVDLYNVSQLSPFFLRGSMRSMNTELVDIWGSILIPVVLTRHCDH